MGHGHSNSKEIFEGKWHQHPLIRRAFYALLIALGTYVVDRLYTVPHYFLIGSYITAVVLGGAHWFREAIIELIKEKAISIEFLVMAATIGSAVLGLWEEAALLVVLFGAAEGIEEFTFARTRASIRKLLDLAPREARIFKNGQEVMIPATELKLDDIFIVKPGESLPTDGLIVKGTSSLNEAPVTGESVPVEKGPGMKVFSATINQDGILDIKTTATFENNTLSKLVHMVEEAREQKGKTQVFIERFGRVYSPAVLIGAIVLLVIPFLFDLNFSEWATRAVVLLVAAAPCALIMSTPVAIAAGIGNAGKNGVLIKGGMHLENLGKLKAIALDKTGTITVGKPIVTDVLSLTGDNGRLLRLAYTLEKASSHPLAHAIVEKAERENAAAFDLKDFRTLVGSGIQGTIENQVYYVGSVKFFEGMNLQLDHIKEISLLREQGKTAVVIGTKEKIEGVIGIQDEVRSNAGDVIKSFHALGLKVIMLTGDNLKTAQAIAEQVGIDDIRADLKPEDKVTAIEQLQRQYGNIAMVGDGINDAPALARADVGIAMGVAGTDAAIEAADAALMGDDLEKLVYAISLGKKTHNVSRQNIVFSLLILLILVPASVFGLITVTVAVIVHEASELLAVMNGLRAGK